MDAVIERFVATRYIFGSLAVAFLAAAGLRAAREGGHFGPAARTWLTIAIIFGAVSAWQWLSRHPS
jgi:hypothetical protein